MGSRNNPSCTAAAASSSSRPAAWLFLLLLVVFHCGVAALGPATTAFDCDPTTDSNRHCAAFRRRPAAASVSVTSLNITSLPLPSSTLTTLWTRTGPPAGAMVKMPVSMSAMKM